METKQRQENRKLTTVQDDAHEMVVIEVKMESNETQTTRNQETLFISRDIFLSSEDMDMKYTVETVIEVKRREEVDCKFDDTGGESSLKEDSKSLQNSTNSWSGTSIYEPPLEDCCFGHRSTSPPSNMLSDSCESCSSQSSDERPPDLPAKSGALFSPPQSSTDISMTSAAPGSNGTKLKDLEVQYSTIPCKDSVAPGIKAELKDLEVQTSINPSTNCVAPGKEAEIKDLAAQNKMNIGDRVQVATCWRCGVLRYSGTVLFASGHWMGIELDTPSGKNDGSVHGKRYFECKAKHGLFVRQCRVHLCINTSIIKLTGNAAGIEGTYSLNKDVLRTLFYSAKPKVGDQVELPRSQLGVVRSIENLKIPQGLWIGIELDDVSTTEKIRYFKCKPGHGPFVSQSRARPRPHYGATDLGKSAKKSGTFFRGLSEINARKIRLHHALYSRKSDSELCEIMPTNAKIGDIVALSHNRLGCLRFIGRVKFAPGFWIGIELVTPTGTSDGSIQGARYFRCKSSYGIFVPLVKVKPISKCGGPLMTKSNSLPSFHLPRSDTGRNVSRSSSLVNLCGLIATGTPSSHAAKDQSISMTAENANVHKKNGHPIHQPAPAHKSGHPPWRGVAAHRSEQCGCCNHQASPRVLIRTGMKVYTKKELAVVKFIGRTKFCDKGVLLGVVFRIPMGRNDGSVDGKRYFRCKMNYGLFVKPENASYRGISCSEMISRDILQQTVLPE